MLQHKIEPAFPRPFTPTPSFLVSDNQTHLLSVLSLGDILVILLDIYGHWRRAHMQMTLILGITPTLVLRGQSQNPIELVALVNDFQQK